MKPVSVRFQCFGPYVAEQFIDFEELEKGGLFLICGETGAGKTTILDAICYALYGRSSGGLRGDMDVMRCKLAPREAETLVEFVFDSGGARYKFTRSLKYKTKNIHDAHNCLILKGDVYVPLLENPKKLSVNRKAEEIIGLTYEQFRQVIILPQGQFERLLVSDSAEKEKILVSLFQADRWHQIARELHRRVKLRDDGLKQELLAIRTKLRDYGCETMEGLSQKRIALAEELALLQQEETAVREDAQEKKQRHTAALLDAHAFQELEKREQHWQRLQRQGAQFAQEEELLALADAAEQIAPKYTLWQEGKAACRRAEGELARQGQRQRTAGENLAAVQQRRLAHEAGRETAQRQKGELLQLEQAGEVYTLLGQKRQASAAARQVHAAAQKQSKGAQGAFARADQAWQEAMARQAGSMDAYRRAQSLYLQGIGSTLAEKLVPGKPCPVCGSLTHPSPAARAAGHVSETELEELNKAMTRAGEAVSGALAKRMQADTARTQADAQTNQASQALAVAEKDQENLENRKIPGIETLAQLNTATQALRETISAYDRAGEVLQQALTDAEGDRKAAQAGVQGAKEALAAAQDELCVREAAWEGALEASGLETVAQFEKHYLEPAQKQRRARALTAYRAECGLALQALEEQRALLEGKARPDSKTLELEMRRAEQRQQAVSERRVLQENNLEKLTGDEQQLLRRQSAHDAARAGVDQDLHFAERLLGSSGVSLQRYVLAVMMNAITVEANRLLENVYGGRYRLYRTDAISGSVHKGGLELEVYDSQNNQRRSVTTLSGGEKFLVALSLAIGLSTVVQAQGSGIRLEAMFIDEGFGSLDREAVRDALEVLQGIQRSAGVVGIISHVETLSESIPARIEITKGRHGSVCRVVT